MVTRSDRFAARLGVAVACFVLFLAVSPASAVLVWHSALDGNANAIVGLDGSAVGSPTPTMDRDGRLFGAVRFNGSGDFFQMLPEVPSLSAGSFSFWARSENHGGERGPLAVGASGGGSSEYFSIQDTGDGRWRVDLDDGAARRDVFSNDVPTLGTWQHVVATFDSDTSQQLRLYVDGVLQTDVQSIAGDVAPYLDANAGNWLIGAERPTERFFEGAIDDVRIYSNELSQAEVNELFSSGPLNTHPDLQVLAAYTFDDFADRGVNELPPSSVGEDVVMNAALNIRPAVPGGTQGSSLTFEASDPGTAYDTAPVLRVFPAGNSTEAQAFANDGYFEFTIEPEGRDEFDLEALLFDAGRGGGSTPRGWALRTSADDFASIVDMADIPTTRVFTPYHVDLSGEMFQDVTDPLTFRFYVYSPGDGSTVEFDNFQVIGSVTQGVPEPATATLAVLALAGLGVRRRRRAA